jgi:hypothetical protein
MEKARYTTQMFFTVAGERVTTSCGHQHKLIGKAIECVKGFGKLGASGVVVRVERGRVVQLDSNDVRSLRAACRYHRLQGAEGAI